MNGEECHNEGNYEEIHRNGAIAFAIYNFTDTQEITVTFLKRIRVLLGLLVSGIKEFFD
jgi:trehalose/maltose hydrolase-like predicted phosphorylase